MQRGDYFATAIPMVNSKYEHKKPNKLSGLTHLTLDDVLGDEIRISCNYHRVTVAEYSCLCIQLVLWYWHKVGNIDAVLGFWHFYNSCLDTIFSRN